MQVETKEKTFDSAKSEAFCEKLIDGYNAAAVSLMTSIGHRTGLFDTMSTLEPSTTQEIADAANLNERYVREWLGAMVTRGFVDYDQPTKRYFLPREHAVWLTRAATPDNLAIMAQYFSVLGAVEDQIVERFENGGGVHYDEFHRFHQVMAEESAQTTVHVLNDHILPLAPGLVDALQKGIDVLDVGCGQGRALTLMAQTYPNSRFVGYDLCEEPIAAARANVKALGLTNIRFERRDVTKLDESETFDLVTAFDAIHDQARPELVLAGINRALRPDGIFLMQDIAASSEVGNNLDHPIAPLIYTISCMHCMTVSLAQENGRGLGAAWGKELAQEMLDEAGFTRVKSSNLPHDILNVYFIATKD